jgi:hypothetical protein
VKRFILLLIAIFLLTGCSKPNIQDLENEPIVTFNVIEETSQATNEPSQNNGSSNNNVTGTETIQEKFTSIDFYLVSGNYCRKVTQDDTEFTEMIVGYRDNFVRVATNEIEQEVFAYNYISDDFTYLYYFYGELISKTDFNIGTGAIIQDPEE